MARIWPLWFTLLSACASTEQASVPRAAALADAVRAADPHAWAHQALHWDGTDALLSRLSQLEPVLRATAAKIHAGLPPDEAPGVDALRALQEHLRMRLADLRLPERLARDVRASLAAEVEVAPLPTVQPFLEGGLGRRMAFARADAESPSGKARMGAYLTRLARAAPNVERRDRLLRLMTISGEDQLWFSLSAGLIERWFSTLGPALPPWFQRALAEEAVPGSSLRDEFRTRIRKTWVLEHTFAYRNLSLAELDEAISFWDSDEGRRYVTARQGAVDAALQGAFAALRADLDQHP